MSVNPDTRLAIAEKIFNIEAGLQGILFAVFLVMRGLYAGEQHYDTGDPIPFWLFTVTGALIILGGAIMALTLCAVTTKTPPTERKSWWIVTLFRIKLGLVFFVIPLASWIMV